MGLAITGMILSSSIQTTLQRHQQLLDTALREAIDRAQASSETHALHVYYGQMRYHLGWVDSSQRPVQSNPGKLLRPTLLLLAYEAAGAWGQQAVPHPSSNSTYLERALPAAIAVELTHNFTLIHDDIEDGDTERRHRPTLWTIWGVPQAINTGDGMFALARFTLWKVLEKGVDSAIAVRLAETLDRDIMTIAEGQYLDISFEQRLDISVSMYLDMIRRKTAALMGSAARLGAMLGTTDAETIERLHSFGLAMGIAFQVRDDILGIWATSAELGKTPAGDIYRRKKGLPFLHAMEQSNAEDQQFLLDIYQQKEALQNNQVQQVLAIFTRTQTQQYCQGFLTQQCQHAHDALDSVPHLLHPIANRAREDLKTLIEFVEAAAR